MSTVTRMVPAAAARVVYSTGGRSRWHEAAGGRIQVPVRAGRTVVAWELQGVLGGVQRVPLTDPHHFATAGWWEVAPS